MVFRRRRLASVRRFTCTAISNGRMERNYTAHVECPAIHVCDIDHGGEARDLKLEIPGSPPTTRI